MQLKAYLGTPLSPRRSPWRLGRRHRAAASRPRALFAPDGRRHRQRPAGRRQRPAAESKPVLPPSPSPPLSLLLLAFKPCSIVPPNRSSLAASRGRIWPSLHRIYAQKGGSAHPQRVSWGRPSVSGVAWCGRPWPVLWWPRPRCHMQQGGLPACRVGVSPSFPLCMLWWGHGVVTPFPTSGAAAASSSSLTVLSAGRAR
jgi:hypothetical protein